MSSGIHQCGDAGLFFPAPGALDTTRSSLEIHRALQGDVPSRSKAPRARRARNASFLRLLKSRAVAAGITRVADISALAPDSFPVFQATRPALYAHALLGQNSGSQGRGLEPTLAQISAIMEALEMHAAEPRNAQLVRGNYDFLSRIHPVLPLRQYASMLNGAEPPADTEPIVWTSAYCIDLGVDVLAPAEALFYGLNARDYQTRPIFPGSSNGLAGGDTLLHATLHGLYELVERHLLASWVEQAPALRVDRLLHVDLQKFSVVRRLMTVAPGSSLAVFAVRHVEVAGLVYAHAVWADEDGRTYNGGACHHSPQNAIVRAVSEAQQSRTTWYSASREDHAFGEDEPLNGHETLKMTPEQLSVTELEREVGVLRFGDDQAELRHLLRSVHQLGFPHVLVKNLTRVGLDVPVVRVLVPGMKMQSFCKPRPYCHHEVMQCKFCLDL